MTRRRIVGKTDGGLLVHDPALGVLWVLPDPKAEPIPAVASAIELRNRATLEGICPGYGGVEVPAVGAIVIEHEPECPAGTPQLRRLAGGSRRPVKRSSRGGNQ